MKLKSKRSVRSEIKDWYRYQFSRYRGLLALESITRNNEREEAAERDRIKKIPVPVKKFSYRSQCRDKRRFLNKNDARREALVLQQRVRHPFNVYLCGYCNYWHVGKDRQNIGGLK